MDSMMDLGSGGSNIRNAAMPVTDDIGSMFPSSAPPNNEERERRAKISTLNTLIDERNYKMNTEIANRKEIREITSTIEANNTQIMKLMQANDILTKARRSHIKDAVDEYNKDNPSDLEKQLAEVSSEQNKGLYALQKRSSVPMWQTANLQRDRGLGIDVDTELKKVGLLRSLLGGKNKK